MSRKTLNLGILAHVDAGKTTLTERLLYAAGAIDAMGSVDKGTTQTDSLALERRRGITIKSAVASFVIDDVTVNLIDTPGHPDFIAEVERVLGVLDGALLVISAVEGVQPQTRLLMRALRRLAVPTLVFINKIDRLGADDERVLRAVRERLTPAAVALGIVRDAGTRAAEFVPRREDDPVFDAQLASVLSEHDESILADFVRAESSVAHERLRAALAEQTQRAKVHPVLAGSALTGSGVSCLTGAIVELLPVATADDNGAASGTVFKIERGRAGEKVAYVRMFSGTLHVRDRVAIGGDHDGKLNAITVFDRGAAERRPWVGAGQIGKLSGLSKVRIGDTIGSDPDGRSAAPQHHFAPPTLETVVDPVFGRDRSRLRVALSQLGEQDPLINVRQDDDGREICVSLYGEVQKEVLASTLADDYAIPVTFREVTPLYIERPVHAGEAVEVLHTPTNPFSATIGFRVEPAPAGSGVALTHVVDPRAMPLYLYKTLDSFVDHMRAYVEDALAEGLFGWQVTDCRVTLIRCAYSVADGPPSRRGPTSTAADFRKLTPLVLRQAVEVAGTVVCEPMVRAELEVPETSLRAVTRALGGASLERSSTAGQLTALCVMLSAARADQVQRLLPELTGGEGLLESTFCGYAPIKGPQPVRRRVGRSGGLGGPDDA